MLKKKGKATKLFKVAGDQLETHDNSSEVL